MQSGRARRSTAFAALSAGVMLISVAGSIFLGTATAAPTSSTSSTPPPASPSRGSLPGSSVSPTSQSRLLLLAQTDWVGTGQPFNLRLSINSTLAATELKVQVTLYQRLTSRAAFEQSLQGRFATSVMRSMTSTRVTDLHPDPTGGYLISVPTNGAPGINFNGCSRGCEGVYPVRIDLRDSSTDQLLDRLTTHMIFAVPVSTRSKLNFALVVPVHSSPATTPGYVSQLPVSQSATLGDEVSALANNPSVPVTLAPTPQVLQALSASGRSRDLETLSTLGRLATSPQHQIVAGPYVNVDLAALSDSGLGTEFAAQLNRGTTAVGSTLPARPDPHTWVTNSGLTASALDELQAVSISQLVVPDSDLATYSTRLTLTQAFHVDGPGSNPPLAVASDPILESHFSNGPDPVLSAHQLLADLATVYFEEPGSARPRVLAADPPSSWTPDPTFLNPVLAALASSPLVTPVTVAEMFALGSQGNSPQVVRRLAGTSSSDSRLPVAQLRSARTKLAGFGSVVGTEASRFSELGDLLLVAESSDLRPSSQVGYLNFLAGSIKAQLDKVSLTPDRAITLTSRNGRIPITIISNAPYTVHAVLWVASDKLTFPHGAAQLLALQPRDNAEYVDVESRSSGDFPMTVSLISPQGGLVLLQARFTVRSTAASSVAIALSVGAVVILVGWWSRTIVRNRRRRALEAAAET